MNCQEYWNTMPEFDADEAHPHLGECADCRSRLNGRRELAAGLRAVAAGCRKLEAPARVEARLVAAFREQSGSEPMRMRRRWIPAATWAAAFAAMFALGLFLVHEREPEAARSTVSRGVERASLEMPADFDGFIPLPNSEAVQADEDMNMVHVEVPRSAMLAVGLEVSADRAGEMVQADVMLGADGVARAVRFWIKQIIPRRGKSQCESRLLLYWRWRSALSPKVLDLAASRAGGGALMRRKVREDRARVSWVPKVSGRVAS